MRQASTTRRIAADPLSHGQGPDEIVPVLSYAAVGKGTVPEASVVCRACGNSAFVAGHLGDLRTGMEESKRYRAQLQYKSSRVLSAPETERKHISKKLHYDTAPALTSIFVRLRFPETSTKDQEVRHSVEELREPTAQRPGVSASNDAGPAPCGIGRRWPVPGRQADVDGYSHTWPVRLPVEAEGLKQMLPVVSFVGNSGVGKTTFLEKLIRVLKRRGYRVAAIKHDAHRFEIDYPGKDSWRLTQAGSDVVIISSRDKLALVERPENERRLLDLIEMVSGRVDIVLTEGYRGADALKIEVSRKAHSHVLTARLDDLMAIVTDERFDYPVPQFGLEDAPSVADYLERRFGLQALRVAQAVLR